MKTNVVYRRLSYTIVSILFSVQNQLGHSYQEKHCQKAVETLLKKARIPYQKELFAPLTINGERIGHYFLDFLIDGKMVLELKAKPQIKKDDINQVFSYLKTTNLKLGIIANFRTAKLTYKRIINPNVPDPVD